MAGHPTIGSTFALAIEGVIARGRDQFVFELGVGPTPVSLEWGAAGLAFAWMTQPLPTFGAVVSDREAFAAAVGVSTERPPRGPARAERVVRRAVSVRPARDTRAPSTRSRSTAGRSRGAQTRAGLGDLPVFFFTPERAGAGNETVYSRMLAPGFGVAEDPATGGASGPLGAYLLHHRLVSPDAARSMLSLQGVAMGRPSRVHISIDSDEEQDFARARRRGVRARRDSGSSSSRLSGRASRLSWFYSPTTKAGTCPPPDVTLARPVALRRVR